MMKFLIVENMKKYYEDNYTLNILPNSLQFCDNKKRWSNKLYTPVFKYLDTHENYFSMELHGEDFFVFYSPFVQVLRTYSFSLRKDVKDMLI